MARNNPVLLTGPTRGLDGRSVLAKARAPLITDGRIGDFWIDTVSKKLYGPKNAAEWPDNGLIRGAQGWAPKLVAEADGVRRVFKIDDWTGGEGTKPGTGYLAADGTVVPDIEDAADFRGEQGPEALIDALDSKTDAVTYDTLMAMAESAGDNEKAALKRLFEPGGAMASRSVAEAAPLFVPSAIQRLAIGRYSYVRRSGEPSHDLKLRTADRYTDEGDHDSANGGYWGIDAPLISIDAAGGQKGADNSTAKAKAIIAAGDDAIIAYGSGWGVGTAQPYWGSSYTDAAGLQIIQGQLASPVGDARAPLLWLEQYDSADADTYRKPGALYVHYAKTSGKKPSEAATFIAENRLPDPVGGGYDHSGLYVMASHYRMRFFEQNGRGTAGWFYVHALPGKVPLHGHGIEINGHNSVPESYPGYDVHGHMQLLNLAWVDNPVADDNLGSDYIVLQGPSGKAWRGIFVKSNAIKGSGSFTGDGEVVSIAGASGTGNAFGGLRFGGGNVTYLIRADEVSNIAGGRAIILKGAVGQGLFWGVSSLSSRVLENTSNEIVIANGHVGGVIRFQNVVDTSFTTLATIGDASVSRGLNLAAIDLYRSGTKVVGARKTGWSVPNGGITRKRSEMSASADTAEIRSVLAALVDDLHATSGHGIIGT